ncbi:MAG: hypothetical protein OXH11_10380 [Candidatus Aminicenantes bacterium]|nr:hypothetical protein [Candidatus Aminicenantes bacterium]
MRLHRWLTLFLGVMFATVACSPEGGGEDGGAGKTVFPKDRKRRILYYDAASQETWGYIDQGRKIPYMKLIADITDHQSFLDVRTNMTFGTQVDTYVFHVGNGADPPYNISTEMLWPCFSSYEEVRDLVIEACHARGMEVWASLRMNDLHASWRSVSLHDLDDPFKIEHPEFLLAPESSRHLPSELTEHMLWSGFNFVHPEVRQHRLDFIERTAAAHDFDGYELDFNRMGISFPLGQERQNAHLLTEMMREARQRLDAVGERRGRPYTLAVHVVDSLERSLELGMEVEAWVREGLVDVLLVGMGHLPSRLRLDQFVSLGRAHGVPVYATLNGNSYRAGAWEGLYGRPVFREGMRASAAYYHQEGADGLYLFNYANEPTQELTREEFISALSELGEAETLAGKNKVYGIHSTAHTGGPIIQGSESALLPVVLDRVETKLPLLMGPDAEDESARFRISLWTADSREDTRIWVRLNHTLLAAPTREEPWYHLEVPAGIMRSGNNELGIISDVPAGGPFPGIVAPPGVQRKDWLGWKRNEGTLVDEFAEGRLVRDPDTEGRGEPEERRPVIVHQIFVTVEYPGQDR